MKRILATLCCLVALVAQAQHNSQTGSDDQNTGSVSNWDVGSEWDVYYTVEPEDADSQSGILNQDRYRLMQADDGYMALQKTTIIGGTANTPSVIGYIRNVNDMMIYVRPVKANGTIGEEMLLYDFSTPMEYGNTVRYGTADGGIKEMYIDWRTDSLDYYIMDGDRHCLPAYKGIIYKYGHVGGPMELFQMNATPGSAVKPKPTNISHVIFTTRKGIRRTMRMGNDGNVRDVEIEYSPMLTEGTEWDCLSASKVDAEDTHTYTIAVLGDTIIGNRHCKVVGSAEMGVRKVMFEEGRKVYVVGEDDTAKVLLDFRVQQGDQFGDAPTQAFVCDRENTGNTYRTITMDMGLECQSLFSGDRTPWAYELIEGVGVSKDEFLAERLLPDDNTISYLLRCWKNGTLIYQLPGYNGDTPGNRKPVKGDINGDGIVSIDDITLLINIYLGQDSNVTF